MAESNVRQVLGAPIVVRVVDEDGDKRTTEDLSIAPFKNIKSDIFIKMAVDILGDLGVLKLVGLKSPGKDEKEEPTRQVTDILMDAVLSAPAGAYRLAAFTLIPNKKVVDAYDAADGSLDLLVTEKAKEVERGFTKAVVGQVIAAGVEATGLGDFFGALLKAAAPILGTIAQPTIPTQKTETTV